MTGCQIDREERRPIRGGTDQLTHFPSNISREVLEQFPDLEMNGARSIGEAADDNILDVLEGEPTNSLRESHQQPDGVEKVTNRRKKLKEIEEQIRSLTAGPLADYRREQGFRPVPGEGDPHARVMLIGEAPGAEEARTGRPFVGRAGRLLEEKLESIGLNRDRVFITNIIKDRPPGNRDPRVSEVERYAPYLDRQISIIQPEVFVTLGRFAMSYLLDRYNLPQSGRRIGELQGRQFTVQEEYGKATLIPLYHPAATFYNPALEEDLDRGFRVLRERLDRSRD